MGTVQFREDEDVLEFVRANGQNPNELAREAFHAKVRRMRAEAAVRRVRANAADLGDVVKLLREDRDR